MTIWDRDSSCVKATFSVRRTEIRAPLQERRKVDPLSATTCAATRLYTPPPGVMLFIVSPQDPPAKQGKPGYQSWQLPYPLSHGPQRHSLLMHLTHCALASAGIAMTAIATANTLARCLRKTFMTVYLSEWFFQRDATATATGRAEHLYLSQHEMRPTDAPSHRHRTETTLPRFP